tara:strand:+ start:14525 stop:14695 length:171 start_codon:yes stop_codon:yes gene_type:complete
MHEQSTQHIVTERILCHPIVAGMGAHERAALAQKLSGSSLAQIDAELTALIAEQKK